ncbi:potassium/proton antiporter [Catelliglobosispora koreensis]|uniref:potassium/proton antiporter n=1 Tax=Catelliglobosispora koreensis TaxID=129052 RepID=UPI000360F0A3|nr:potassium/proton antiporter [Catelliglobosispora koreensis]
MSAFSDVTLLFAMLVLLFSVAAVRWSTRIGVPTLLVYLAIGVLLGESFIGVEFSDAELTRQLGFLALVLIIAEGGLGERWSRMRTVLPSSVALATAGVLVSVGVVAVFTHYALGQDWQTSLLMGAVISSTDAAAVFSVFRRLSIRPKIKSVLESESGMNDPTAALLVILFSSTPDTQGPWWSVVLLLIYELVAGLLIGVFTGVMGMALLKRAALPAAGLYPLAVVALMILAYSGGVVAHASGFMAVYVCAVILGNARLPHRQAIVGFADGVAWLAQIGLFVMLGLLVSPPGLPGVLIPALLIGAALTFIARPVSVAVSLAPFKWTVREKLFLSWAGLRGAVPIVFATIPLAGRVTNAPWLFNVVFVLVIVFTLVQASTLPAAAKLLGVSAPNEPTEVRVEIAPLERMRADMLQLDIREGSQLAGVHLDELRLPVGAVVTMVLRDGSGFVPVRDTRLIAGDSLLIVATEDVRDETERRLRAVSRRGRLARWFGEEGAELNN